MHFLINLLNNIFTNNPANFQNYALAESSSDSDITVSTRVQNVAGTIREFLDANLAPILVTLIVAGAFLVLILGIQLAKAEDSASATKLKQRMWHTFFGIFILIALIFLLYWLLGEIGGIVESIQNQTQIDTSSSVIKYFVRKI